MTSSTLKSAMEFERTYQDLCRKPIIPDDTDLNLRMHLWINFVCLLERIAELESRLEALEAKTT